ncbi:TRAP transporter substrate-binding protein DctP, partial [Thermodesulfobacteriota bacterium]
YEFKISVDTVMNHPRNQGLLTFIDEIKKRSQGQLEPKLFHSAQLYKDKAAPKALALGTLDMAVPGVWYLSSYDVNADITSLPMFFGQPPEITRGLVDGDWGKAISETLGKKMRVKVLGRFYEIGYLETFMVTKPIAKLEDFKGTKIRYPGSPSLSLRINSLGASSMAIPFADVPMALLQGTVDGLLTTFKTAEGVKLYESGVKYAVKDRGCLLHYAPMVSLKFWNSLPNDLQKVMVDSWDASVDPQRKLAIKMQKDAEKTMKEKGVQVYAPSAEVLAQWRNHMMPNQAPYVKKAKMDPELIKLAKEKLGM